MYWSSNVPYCNTTCSIFASSIFANLHTKIQMNTELNSNEGAEIYDLAKIYRSQARVLINGTIYALEFIGQHLRRHNDSFSS